MDIIVKTDKGLTIPDNPTIPYIMGDGVGKDITPVVLSIIDEVLKKCYGDNKKITWIELLAGENSFNKTGEWLPKETMEEFKKYLIGIKGPLTTPIGGGIRSLNVALRQELDLYVCLRPVSYFNGVPSPVKHPEDLKAVIFRENTEDIYAGIEFKSGSEENNKLMKFLTEELGVKAIRFPESSSLGVKPVSIDGSSRLIRAAIEYAVKNKLPSVTLVHKGNIMKFTEGCFRDCGYDIAETEFKDSTFTYRTFDKIKSDNGIESATKTLNEAKALGKIIIKDCIADAFLQDILINPKDHSVVATLNLNGDYISDLLAAMVGGIGIAPGANINYTTGAAIFEATHGTALAIAGKNVANPGSMLLSGAMMLEYMGWREASTIIMDIMQKCITAKEVTNDFAAYMDGATSLSTSDFGNKFKEHLSKK